MFFLCFYPIEFYLQSVRLHLIWKGQVNHCFLIFFFLLFMFWHTFVIQFPQLLLFQSNESLFICYLCGNSSVPFNICFSHDSKFLFLSVNCLLISHYSMGKFNIVFTDVHYYAIVYCIFSSLFISVILYHDLLLQMFALCFSFYHS